MYAGEGGEDAGGLFRDCITHMCGELCSEVLPLFVPAPNKAFGGKNSALWVPNKVRAAAGGPKSACATLVLVL